MKSRIFASLLLAGFPWLVMAQSNDDLYFVPKKKTEAKKEAAAPVERTVAVPKQSSNTTVYAAPGSTVVVKDAAGKMRDVDEYNRRYTSRDNTFSYRNDTLYIEEKPVGERGEWVNGFEGSQDDYEYAMRIVRFRSPAYAIPVSSPLYWDVVYGAFPSWDWNVYDDGLYAYVFPTYSNPLWWDWRWNWSIAGPRWGWGWSWYSPWYYSSWYSPYWYGGYWGGWYGGWYAGYWGGWHHHHYPYYGWGGGWRGDYTDYRPSRYQRAGTSVTRRSSGGTVYGVRRSSENIASGRGASSVRRSSIGRVVQGSSGTRGEVNSVRSGRTAIRGRGETVTGTRAGSRSQGVYTRPSMGVDRSGSTYNRPSSTRRSVNYGNQRNYNTNTRSSYQNTSRSSSFSRGSGSSFSRGSGGGGSVTRSSGGGGGRRK